MPFIRKLLRLVLFILAGTVVIAVAAVALFVHFYPSFGDSPSEEEKKFYASGSGNYKDGKFQNEVETSMDMGFWEGLKVAREFFRKDPSRQPLKPLPQERPRITQKPEALNDVRLTWFGHSAFLIQSSSGNILLDPMFGSTPAPHPLLGSGRFEPGLPVNTSELPEIDVVLISHDHYDHLDYPSIRELDGRVSLYLVPLGVAAHLRRWGVAAEKIRELNWWDDFSVSGMKFTCAPARHFSGRGLFNRFSTLWCSWVLELPTGNIYFSGDSGYGPHFPEIGTRMGPFDLALLECGQYNERWEAIHMMPEQTAQAGLDLRAKAIMPIHWAAFTLSLHPWKEPAERLKIAAAEKGIPIFSPMIGQTVSLKDSASFSPWWESVK